jgi:hypothetical protein
MESRSLGSHTITGVLIGERVINDKFVVAFKKICTKIRPELGVFN